MSKSHQTNSRTQPLTLEQQQLRKTISKSLTASTNKRSDRRPTSPNATLADTKVNSTRRRLGATKPFSTGSDVDSFHSAQRSISSPKSMSTVNYTKTGRVSKAKKGLKVHECECGRSYTRAEHLRRHQRNHAQESTLVCKFPSCGKAFFRTDLLQRHEERHDELGNVSRRTSISSTEHSANISPKTVPGALPEATTVTTPPPALYQRQHLMSPRPEVTQFPRYTPSLFRAPQPPRVSKIAPFRSSNHVFHSSQIFQTTTNSMKQQDLAHPARRSISGPILVDGTAASGVWHESLAQSPYSCSSGYASPAPGFEYSHIYATPPFRTRASSNASFIDQIWAHASQSPTSCNSLSYSWPPDEKSIVSSTFAFLPVTYATSSMPIVDNMPHYAQFDPHDMVQMDNEEGLQLFPGHYGMSQIAHAYPFEQWLNNYWRLFHPAFPVVHRFTLACRELSPMLYAAMIAIDLQYSHDASQRQRAMELHKSCMRLLLERDQLGRIGCDRLCDDQAIFLVEVYSQYHAQRCSKALSERFERMYGKLTSIRAVDPLAILDLQLLDEPPEEHIQDRWTQWSRLTARNHLLLSCYVLCSQQRTLLARQCRPDVHITHENLPFPAHESFWIAKTASEWMTVIHQQPPKMPKTVQEALQVRTGQSYNVFQSTVLVTACYEFYDGPALSSSATFEHLLSQTTMTRIQLWTTKLTHLVPIRALLSVSGETWLFGTKLTSPEECSALKSTLRNWIGQIWSPIADNNLNTTMEALQVSITILRMSLETENPRALGLGGELGSFFAVLVLWAATAASGSRYPALDLSSHHLQPSILLESNMISTPRALEVSHAIRPANAPLVHYLAGVQSTSVPSSSDGRSSIPRAEIFLTCSRFLSTALDKISTFDIAPCRTGCTNLLLWTKMYLRGDFTGAADIVDAGGPDAEHYRGEIINEAISQIDRMLDHGWVGWGI